MIKNLPASQLFSESNWTKKNINLSGTSKCYKNTIKANKDNTENPVG